MTSTAHRASWILARCAQVAILVAAVADVFRAAAVRDHYLHGTDTSSHESGFVSMVFVYLMTLAIVLFLVWLARSRRNAQELSPEVSLPSRSWTIGAWFIPGVNFVVPRRFVLDIGRASAEWEQKRDTALVNLWWGAWITHSVVLLVAVRAAPGSMAFLVMAEALMIAAAVLLGLVIERITTLQSSGLADTDPRALQRLS